MSLSISKKINIHPSMFRKLRASIKTRICLQVLLQKSSCSLVMNLGTKLTWHYRIQYHMLLEAYKTYFLKDLVNMNQDNRQLIFIDISIFIKTMNFISNFIGYTNVSLYQGFFSFPLVFFPNLVQPST